MHQSYTVRKPDPPRKEDDLLIFIKLNFSLERSYLLGFLYPSKRRYRRMLVKKGKAGGMMQGLGQNEYLHKMGQFEKLPSGQGCFYLDWEVV